jgi:hypothetical protein
MAELREACGEVRAAVHRDDERTADRPPPDRLYRVVEAALVFGKRLAIDCRQSAHDELLTSSRRRCLHAEVAKILYRRERDHSMNKTARFVFGCMVLLGSGPPALGQSAYPAQPIRFVVTTAPGGGLDSFSRLLAKELSARGGQQVIVDNRPGAGTTIGSAAVAKAKPDGYTVLLNTSAFAISPAIYQKLPYDPLRDFTAITMAVSAPNVMVVHPSVPVKSVRDVIVLAKARASQGDPILYASGGAGTNGHLAAAACRNA